MFFRCMMYTNIIYTYTRIILENNNRHKRTNLSLSLSKKSSCVFKNNMWFSNFCILQVICIICILHNEASRPRLTHDSQTEQTERRGFLTPLTELQDGRGGFWIWILEDFPLLLLLLLFFSGGKSNDLVNSILFPYIQFIVFFGSLEDFGKSIDDERCGFGRIERFPRLAVSRFVLVILVPQRGWMSSSTGVWNICTLWKEIDMICVYWDVKLLGYYRCYIYIYTCKFSWSFSTHFPTISRIFNGQDGANLPRSTNHRRFNYPHTLSYKADHLGRFPPVNFP